MRTIKGKIYFIQFDTTSHRMGLHMKKQGHVFNQENRKKGNDDLTEEIDTNNHSSVMITENQIAGSTISKLQQQIEQLEQEKESLRIDNVCLQQQNHELQTRIDDVATHFPKTSILLGKKPDAHQRKNKLNLRFTKRK
jgi:predicted transcriptional regulator